MDIMMFLCKSLHVVALSFITIIFLYRLHSSKPPDEADNFSKHVHNNIVHGTANSVKTEI